MNILVLGSNGMLGRYVHAYLKSTGLIVAGVNRGVFNAANSTGDGLDVLINRAPSIFINCIGIIKQRADVPDVEFIKVNSVFPLELSNACERIGHKLIHITTDCVFDGLGGYYNEKSEHNAKDIYGVTKSLGEPENATVVRTSIIGEEIGQARSLVEWVKSNKDKEVSGYTNHFWNGITCLEFARVCEKIISQRLFWKGVKHITSPTGVSKFELVKMISDIYALNLEIIPHETDVKCDRTMSSMRTDVDIKVPELKNQIIEMKNFYQKLTEV